MNSGKTGKVKINTSSNSIVKTNAEEISIVGTEHHSSNSGKIVHKASNRLNQIDNTMLSEHGGEITNESAGELNQINNEMKARYGGKINNIVNKSRKPILVASILFVLTVLSIIADFMGIIDFLK